MADPGSTTTIFVGGLPQDCPAEALRQYFESYGNVTDAIVKTDRDTGRSRGFGFIFFDSTDTVEQVMSRHSEHRIQDKWIDVKRALPQGDARAPRGPGGRGDRNDRGDRGRDERGDWTCPNCNATVYASKSSCFKCKSPRPAAGAELASYPGGPPMGAPTPAGLGYYPPPPPPSSAYGAYGAPSMGYAPPGYAYGAYAGPGAYGAYGPYGAAYGGAYGGMPPGYPTPSFGTPPPAYGSPNPYDTAQNYMPPQQPAPVPSGAPSDSGPPSTHYRPY